MQFERLPRDAHASTGRRIGSPTPSDQDAGLRVLQPGGFATRVGAYRGWRPIA